MDFINCGDSLLDQHYNVKVTKTHDNTLVRKWLLEDVTTDFNSTLSDVLRGATGQLTGTKRPSNDLVLMRLQSLDRIDFNTVGRMLSRKTAYIDGVVVSKTLVKQWVNVLTCASKAIVYHFDLVEQRELTTGEKVKQCKQNGLTQKEACVQLGLSIATIKRNWN